MLRAKKTEPRLSAAGCRFGVVAARYNADLADALLANCLDTLAKAGADTRDIKVVRVPGSFEITAAAAKLARSGACDCLIGLGLILQGETSHAHHIGNAVAHGLTDIAIQTGVPTVFGVVTADNRRQARVRCVGEQYNRGREAALTAIEMAQLWKNL
ncbi:MAG TPA: 6,7-dimethyl-8-ribityllumazine synthase [Verrucomicrobiae bacterium]|nr:6,7-dimethyl-8-ribityllumazine synthase [Verrucomicrobiae bacterium]